LIAIARGHDDVLSAIGDFPRYRVTVGRGDHPLGLRSVACSSWGTHQAGRFVEASGNFSQAAVPVRTEG
jgi:hypothetical protein